MVIKKSLHIIIPAAGLGTRFRNSIFVEPKPIITWHGKPMLSHAIENFLEDDIRITVIKQKSLEFTYNDPRVSIININYITNGPASTAYLADINEDDPLIITNCDQIIKDWNLDIFINFVQKYDAVLGCFFSHKDHNSYVEINDKLLVTKVREKEKISNIATNGLHYWNKGRYFIESYESMLANKDTVFGEYYIAPTYNYLINKGYHIGIYMFNQHYPIGTPEQLKDFISDENR